MTHDQSPPEHTPKDYQNPTTNPLVFFHSPLSIMAQFVLLMQSRFEQVPNYTYSDNEEETSLFISTEYNRPGDIEGEMPLVTVGRGTCVANTPVIGNRAEDNDNYVRHGGEYKYGENQLDIQYSVMSQTYGECEIIGDIIQSSIYTGKYIIKKNLYLKDIGPVAFQPPTLYEQDYFEYRSSVQFRITIGQRWFTLPTAPVLKRIQMELGYSWDEVRTIIEEATDLS